jgi:hypothetical protein
VIISFHSSLGVSSRSAPLGWPLPQSRGTHLAVINQLNTWKRL